MQIVRDFLKDFFVIRWIIYHEKEDGQILHNGLDVIRCVQASCTITKV